MQSQGTAPVNADYFAQLTAQIDAIGGPSACAELQALVQTAMADIEAQLAAIRSQIAALLPVITIPDANPGAIVSWITSFVAPYAKAMATFEAQLAQTLSEVAALQSAIERAAGRLLCVSVTIPSVS